MTWLIPYPIRTLIVDPFQLRHFDVSTPGGRIERDLCAEKMAKRMVSCYLRTALTAIAVFAMLKTYPLYGMTSLVVSNCSLLLLSVPCAGLIAGASTVYLGALAINLFIFYSYELISFGGIMIIAGIILFDQAYKIDPNTTRYFMGLAEKYVFTPIVDGSYETLKTGLLYLF